MEQSEDALKDNGHKEETGEIEQIRKEVSGSSVENALRATGQHSALQAMVDPGNSVRGLAMRTTTPDKVTDGVVRAIALTQLVTLCKEYHYKIGEEELLDLLALMPSVGNQRMNDYVSAVIGERVQRFNDKGGLTAWAKKKAYGEKENAP